MEDHGIDLEAFLQFRLHFLRLLERSKRFDPFERCARFLQNETTGVRVGFDGAIQQRQRHFMLTETDVVLGYLDEDICGTVMAIAESRFVEEQGTAMIVMAFIKQALAILDISNCMEKPTGSV